MLAIEHTANCRLRGVPSFITSFYGNGETKFPRILSAFRLINYGLQKLRTTTRLAGTHEKISPLRLAYVTRTRAAIFPPQRAGALDVVFMRYLRDKERHNFADRPPYLSTIGTNERDM